MSPFVQLVFDGPLARLTLKRGDKLNALDQAMIHSLADAARTIDETSEACVTILSGEGKAFCAGGDIGAWGALPPLEMWRSWTRAGPERIQLLPPSWVATLRTSTRRPAHSNHGGRRG